MLPNISCLYYESCNYCSNHVYFSVVIILYKFHAILFLYIFLIIFEYRTNKKSQFMIKIINRFVSGGFGRWRQQWLTINKHKVVVPISSQKVPSHKQRMKPFMDDNEQTQNCSQGFICSGINNVKGYALDHPAVYVHIHTLIKVTGMRLLD